MKCKGNKMGIIIVVILAITLLLSILSFFRKDSARNLETIKVGGVENMKSVQELYKSESYIAQQGAAIDQALAQINTEINLGNEPTDGVGLEENVEGTLEEETKEVNEENTDVEVNNTIISALEDIKKSGIIHGNNNARFTILEYSELLCPFCQRQSSQETINKVLEKYPNDVNAIFRNFIVHGGAAKLGEGLKCFQKYGKDNKFYDFLKAAFAAKGNLDSDSMSDLAKEYGANKSKIKSCIDNGEYTSEVNNETSEGRRLFGVTGTPGNVIIDKETGKFVLIPGAYPPEKFIEEIEKMKAE